MSYIGSQDILKKNGLNTSFTYSEMEYKIKGNKIFTDQEGSVFNIKGNELTFISEDNNKMCYTKNNSIDLTNAIKESVIEY